MLFECYQFLQSITLLGALVSSVPENSVAVLRHESGRTSLTREGDYIHAYLRVVSIQNRRKMVLECYGEVFEWRFWSTGDSESQSAFEPIFVPTPDMWPDVTPESPEMPSDF